MLKCHSNCLQAQEEVYKTSACWQHLLEKVMLGIVQGPSLYHKKLAKARLGVCG